MAKHTNAFRLRDTVTWDSQSGGFKKQKLGKIIIVVPANEDLHDYLPTDYLPIGSDGFGLPRNHETYLVQIDNSKRLYWPRASALSKIN